MYLHIFRRQSPVRVLGPYQRAVLWVQGCHFACPGCLVPESWSQVGGETLSLQVLADWILAQTEIEGITLSGGEPMLQANALSDLITRIRQIKDLGVVCYTGYRWEYLQQQGSLAQQTLLQQIDLLIDGTYIEAHHDNLLWRGSNNQRLLLFTKRYQAMLQQYLTQGDLSAGLEFGVDLSGAIYFTGVPALQDFRQKFAAQLQGQGITIKGMDSGKVS